MSDISEEELKYLAENADRLVPYCPLGNFARIQAEALAARELKKKEEEKENEEEEEEEENNNKKKKKKDEVNNDEEKSDEEGNENWEDDDEENEGWESEEDEHEDWGGYPKEGLPMIFHLSHFDYDKDGNLVPRVGPKTLALYYDEETGDYVGEVIAKVEPQEVEEQEAKQQKAKEQKIEQHNVEEPTKQPYSKPAPQRKPRTNLSLPKPIPAFPGYKNPNLRIKEDWTLPIYQVDWKALHYREVMRSREMGEWHRSQYRLAVKDRKKAWKKASQRLKEGRGVVMTEVVQEPDQLEI